MLGSTVVQALVVAAAAAASAAIGAKVTEPEPVTVRRFRPAPVPRAPPPPPAAPRRVQMEKPKKGLPKPQPQALLQPREIPKEVEPDPGPPEPEGDSGSGEGVVGGAAGGVPGGAVGGSGASIEEGPVDPTAGYRKPQLAEPGCVQRHIHVPEEWMERLGVVTVKFAIGKDGSPSRFQSLSSGFAVRVAPSIWRAVQACRWIPGTDAQGRPVAIWVVLPVRFALE